MWLPPAALSGYRIVNRGVGYQTTAQMLLRIDEDVVKAQPKVVVIEAGVNDLRTIADFPKRRAEIVADCEANLARIVTGCRQAGANVVLVTIFGIGDVPLWRRPFWSSDVSAAIGEVNAFLPKLTGEGVVLFDANPALIGADGTIQRAYQFDYLHLSPAGYDAINAKLVPVVSPLLK
jgi:lysophospholipase L1-like esterase